MRHSSNHGGVTVDRKAAQNQIKGKRLEVEGLSCSFGNFPHSAFNYVISDASEELPQTCKHYKHNWQCLGKGRCFSLLDLILKQLNLKLQSTI